MLSLDLLPTFFSFSYSNGSMRSSTISLSRLSIRTMSKEHLLLRDDIEWQVTGPTGPTESPYMRFR